MTNVATMWQLQSTVLILLSASVASMACLPDGAGDAIHNDLGAGMVRYQAEQLQISFAYPDSLLAGRFREDPLPQVAIDQGMEPPFLNAVVLIQRGVLGDHDLEAIPVGELPVIWIDRSIAASGAFEILAPDSSYEVRGLSVSRFPGFPGPYGDQAHYYVVDLGDRDYVELGAHRYWFRTEGQAETHYDQIIEEIIPTIERLPR